jgi:hypothetical protein
MEREITSPVLQCAPDGRLNPEAVGWSRRPLVGSNLEGRFGRKKRWTYWCVSNGDHLVSLTCAHLDWMALGVVLAIDLRTGERLRRASVRPFGAGCALPRDVEGETRFDGAVKLNLSYGPRARLQASARDFECDIEVEIPPDHDTLSVLVPWSRRLHQYTSKQFGLPARGEARWNGTTRSFAGGSFAALDHGRGVWPWRTRWNWACAANGSIGFNLGAQWTDGTGVTENGVVVDRRLEKISEDARFEWKDPKQPWRITTPSLVSLDFQPLHHEHERLELGLVGSSLELCFGRFNGTICGHEVRDLFGWAEEHHARW